MSRVNAGGEIGRNDPCPCGSGKKYKKCCMGKATPRQQAAAPPPAQDYREMLQVAADHAQAGRLAQAQKLFTQVLQDRPSDVRALHGMARVMGQLNQPQEAISLLRRAVAVDERQVELHVMLSNLCLRVANFEEAERSARRAIKLDPNNEAAHRMIAECHQRMHRLDDAIAEVNKALSINPGSVDAEIFLAVLQQQMGDLAEARSRLEGVLGRKPDLDQRLRAQKELGFVLDKLGEYGAAFEMFEQGGLETARTPAAQRTDREATMKLVDGYKAVATAELLSKWTRDAFDDDRPRPSFLVGFPRSGTTLTERVMAAHPDVVTADEKPVLDPVTTRMAAMFSEGDIPGMLPELDRDDIARLRDAYWEQAETVMQMELSGKTYVDKLPLNIIHLPLINVMFPEARIIVALRDPRDVCLSCFMQRFELNTAMINFLWWERTAEFYARVMDLWLHLRDKVTLDFIEVRYEDTVDDFESQARTLLDFLGVGWDEGVLEFHKESRKKFISTPSFTGVSEKIYKRSAGRWRNYEDQVPRVSGTLDRFITAFGYA
ncbi:MAG: sulfotransferase [Planctomycetota bacterium]|jgi:tetratricopeptide (TPR) repeat protein